MNHALRGMTLLEMLIVVAIVGILSTLGVVSIVSMTQIGRVNSAAGTLTRALVDARLRSMTQHCSHVVQVNGPTYAATSALVGAPRQAGSVSVIRKARCTSTTMRYEAGGSTEGFDRDRVLTTAILGDDAIATRGVKYHVVGPTGIIAGGDELTRQALAIGYSDTGARSLLVDVDTGAGFVGGTTSDFTLAIAAPTANADAGVQVTVVIPTSGVASRP
jgi:prepilin-type N-terminal cleavage/methylation domain-containing protein